MGGGLHGRGIIKRTEMEFHDRSQVATISFSR